MTLEPQPVLRPERLLIELLDDLSGGSILCTSLGRAQLAAAAAARFSRADVVCWFVDLYRAELAAASLGVHQPNLQLVCAADLPDETFDAVLMPFTAQGEAEWTRELMQQAHERLATEGVLLVATDNVRDRWLRAEMEKLFERITRHESADAVAYRGRKTGPLKKFKDFSCEVVFRDQDRLLRSLTRPGVFAHRRIDPGARKLLEGMEVRPGDRVLDIGCGSGIAALGAAARGATAVLALDANARAVQCTEVAAEWNGLGQIAVELTTSDAFEPQDAFELALANPPYFSGFRIAASFLEAAQRSLVRGGRLLVVTKFPDWYLENAPELFDDVQVEATKGYFLVRAIQP